jgi:hypothetical protein
MAFIRKQIMKKNIHLIFFQIHGKYGKCQLSFEFNYAFEKREKKKN